ncbi:MAG: glucosaminidase domain-containing protein [Chloroflexi bacterium]|uniref:Glucosaminidase domain-containing protein n=1 Tax=Candidatus Chlorohelix allophototropha TaxID=3003348 RepID=A0A8T7M2E4_9CHLR|nr:glucosaminidase domain-containing protein [Chloroflexota bacterium]WJW65959.1 glucosaminidase domain-containing protein [Chloroflexota bacterium L227-S17]
MSVTILGSSTVSREAYKAFLSQRNPAAPLEVIDSYYDLESKWGIRADVLAAQMCHETGYLTSWWSKPPRRNMAGIGVTGEVANTNPNTSEWAFKQEDGKWYKGLSFADWTAAVNCHYAHMVAYTTSDERNNASQYDPRFKAARSYFAAKGWKLPIVQVLTDLNGKWAVPGTGYGENIEKIMNLAATFTPPIEKPPTPVIGTAVYTPVEMPVLTDRTDNTSPQAYLADRNPFRPQLLVILDTVGDSSNPDRNDLNLDAAGYQARENISITALQSANGYSVNYYVGAEELGAPVFLICPETGVTSTIHGSDSAPSRWVDPFNTEWKGQYNGSDLLNYIVISIARWGAPDEQPGVQQTRAILGLSLDIARRYSLTPQRVVALQEISPSQLGGTFLVETVRTFLGQQLGSK